MAEANAAGILAAGPIPADALFPQAVRGRVGIRDRLLSRPGPRALQSVYGDDGVNITVGLPVVRVSVDHGTAFDIAGKGIARETAWCWPPSAPPTWPRLVACMETARAQTGG